MRTVLDTFVLLGIVASLPVCYLWPWVGSLVWGWLNFLYPYRAGNAVTFDLHFGWAVTFAILAGVAVHGRRYRLPWSREMYLMLALWAFCALTTAVAATRPETAWPRFFSVSKMLSITLVVMLLGTERGRLRQLAWVTALSLAAYAVLGAAWVLITGGGAPLYGPRGSDIENNNDLAPALAAVAPFFVFLGFDAERPWVRRGSMALFGVIIVAILGTYSRAAVLALGAMLVLLAVFARWRALAVAGVAWAVFMACTAPQAWVERVDSIRTYERDESASLRPNEWYVAFRLGLDHPFLGAGFQPFTAEVHQRYVPDSRDHRDAHNMFLQVFAEHGFPGLALYVALIGSTLVTLCRRAFGPAHWSRAYARMLLTGTLVYLVDGMFHCLSYRDIFFHLLALSMMVDAVAKREVGAAAIA